MLNKYVWQLYLASGGMKTIELFRRNLTVCMMEEYAAAIKRMQLVYCACEAVPETTFTQLMMLYEDEQASTYTMPVKEIINEASTSIMAEEEIINDENEEDDEIEIINSIFQDWYEKCIEMNQGNEKAVFMRLIDQLPYISTAFAMDYPGLFVPYYFFSNYNVLTVIANNFDIVLPALPKKSDYKARIWHYAEICKALYEFRKENALSFPEMCAFLYDFAPQYIGGKESYIINDLPQPKGAYFIGGGGDNNDAIAENNPDHIVFWQSNPGTRAGDMIVMYLRTPISSISSIWRSCSVGFIDPFFYYYRCTFIGMPMKGRRIGLKEMTHDSILGRMPIVHRNMQGINGIELMPSEYNHIVEITGAKVPRLEQILENADSEYENEKAVEEKLIKPLIAKLGYSETEYVQQLYLEIGNHNHALIPDFVLHPLNSRGHYSAFAVIEAKRSIKYDKHLEDAKTQLRSYAKLLSARYAVVASKEKIWVMHAKGDYASCIFESTWESLQDVDTFYSLNKLIGNK